MQWFAHAPANIALIKYMGKQDTAYNTPDNASLSYTLNQFQSHVMLETQLGEQDHWAPLVMENRPLLQLTSFAQTRFLNHLAMLKTHFGYIGSFIVRSNNTFPHSSGLASSASSFAALTQCAVKALCDLTQQPLWSVLHQAQLSRLGSGSSCRSFFEPWVLWDAEQVYTIDLPYPVLIHQVIVVNAAVKSVSSSEAHQRVKTSPAYATRAASAASHLEQLLRALKQTQWEVAYHLCWAEFQEMHALFDSCSRPFSYITDKTTAVLDALQALWVREGDGPIVTMDAGPNIHILYRPDQAEMAARFQRDHLSLYHVL